MKSKTILGADGATKMRQITVGIHGKGGEAGIKAIQQLAGMGDSLKQCQTPQEVKGSRRADVLSSIAGRK